MSTFILILMTLALIVFPPIKVVGFIASLLLISTYPFHAAMVLMAVGGFYYFFIHRR